MARGRMLNKTVSLSQKFANLPDDTCRLLATWLIRHLDLNGVFYADPAIVRSQIFPMRDDVTTAQVAGYLVAMEKAGLIVIYEANGRKWQHWPGFADNQSGLRYDREKTSNPLPTTAQEKRGENPAEIPPDDNQTPAKSHPKLSTSTKEIEEEKKEEISADAPADLSENPPAPPKPDTPKPHEHPAIKAFREVTARYPPKELFADVIKACGDVPDLDRMRKCWLAWLKVSGNRANTTWVLDWYANGHSGNPDKSRANGARASPQTAEAPKSRIGKGMNW